MASGVATTPETAGSAVGGRPSATPSGTPSPTPGPRVSDDAAPGRGVTRAPASRSPLRAGPASPPALLAVADMPEAVDDQAVTRVGQAVRIRVLANDLSTVGTTITLWSQPSRGRATTDGSAVTYPCRPGRGGRRPGERRPRLLGRDLPMSNEDVNDERWREWDVTVASPTTARGGRVEVLEGGSGIR